MSLLALGLLLAAAALHAGWNLLLKQAGEQYVTTWWALVVGSACFLPSLLVSQPLPAQVWPYVLGSAVCEAAYFAVLVAAYRRGDFSLVYPIARGTAPVFLALWSVLWFGEYPSVAGAIGLAVVVLGLAVVGSSEWWGGRRLVAPGAAAVGLALLVALFISLYSVIDDAAVRVVHPVPYVAVVFALTAVILTPVVAGRYGWGALTAGWRANWLRIGLIGVLAPAAYMLVVGAYALSPVSYAGAIREVSVVLAALAGWRWSGERFGAIRVLGAILIFCGILLIGVAG